MKKSIVLGIVGLAAAAVTSYGQGYITLDNYSTSGAPIISYGAGVPLNGVSGGLGSGGLQNGWTVGLYFAVGTPSFSDPAGTGTPNVALALGVGTGATVATYSTTFNTPGAFQAPNGFNTGAAVGGTVTVELIAYDTAGGSYANAAYRAHSAPFTMPTVSIISTSPSAVGTYMAGFSVAQVPEPTTLALGGLGGLALLLMRRKQS